MDLTNISFKASKENEDENFYHEAIPIEHNHSSINRNNETICNMLNELNLYSYELKENEDSNQNYYY